MLLVAGHAWGTGVDAIYPPEVLSAWQDNISHFANGVLQGEILPALTADEKQRLGKVAIRVPPSEAGQEPLDFRRDGETIVFSAASMHLLGDLLMSYAWLGRNGYQVDTLGDYMLMLAYWCAAAPPPAPRVALYVPDNAHDDAATDKLATLMTHDAMLFLILHELGHVLHHDPGATQLTSAASQLAEMAADGFALDVLRRIGRVPTGIAIYFEEASAFDAPQRQCGSGVQVAMLRPTHPSSLARLRQVAADIDANASRYARDGTPQTLAEFRLLSEQLEALIDSEGDPRAKAFLPQLGPSLTPADLAPRHRHEIIAVAPGSPSTAGAFSGKLAGTITIAGMPFNTELVLRRRGDDVTGDYGLSCDFNRCAFGHLDGRLDGDTLRFAWSSASQRGSGVLVRSGDDYVGSTGMGSATEGAPWKLHIAPE
jgi:hypothetical protein